MTRDIDPAFKAAWRESQGQPVDAEARKVTAAPSSLRDALVAKAEADGFLSVDDIDAVFAAHREATGEAKPVTRVVQPNSRMTAGRSTLASEEGK